jgi:hypothetical protein
MKRVSGYGDAFPPDRSGSQIRVASGSWVALRRLLKDRYGHFRDGEFIEHFFEVYLVLRSGA